MKVDQVMSAPAHAVGPKQNLQDAAQLMWDRDCGWLPVLDDGGTLVGVITDRDVCMAAYTRGRRLDEISVAGTMVTQVFDCKPDDAIADVAELMQRCAVRRVPVVDDEGKVVGVVSLSDLTRHIDHSDIGETLSAICKPRGDNA